MTNKKTFINTLENNRRLSSQELLQQIYEKINEGYSEFEIIASGQHNIGGPLWLENGGKLVFKVTNPGQRVGSMGMHGTQIIVEGSAPADVGWLNAGAEIVVKGDGGDTTAHCAATGKIFVGGRVGTRSGSLMKHDPKFAPPELWILKNTGSFSFEFMGGGVAVVCGVDCENFESVLGKRSCVGMLGGTVYVRGNVADVSNDVWLVDIDEKDKEFLKNGLKDFLEKIDRNELTETLIDFSQWKKIVAKTFEERVKKPLISMKDFREKYWVEGGIFGDLLEDTNEVAGFAWKGSKRLRIPEWSNSAYCAPCEYNCPIGIPTQKRISLIKDGKIKEALELVLDYSPFPASVCGQVCPNLCMEECNRQYVDEPIKVAELGLQSKSINIDIPAVSKSEKIAIIGSGVAGLSSAWQLRKAGYIVEIFEQDKIFGGKLKQVIPEDRLARDILDAELNRIEKSGIKINLNTKITEQSFEKIQNDFDAVVVAIGAHVPVVIPFEGHEKLIKGLEFLKNINNSNLPKIGEKVVVIGAGNAAMDVVIGAYQCGAKDVTAIDIQKPAAFEKEIKHAKNLGAKIMWPCFTSKVSDEGVHLKDGTLLEADTVIIAVGDRPEFSFLNDKYLDEKGKVQLNEYLQSEYNKKVFVAGDAIKQGLFTNALADGRNVALNIEKMFKCEPLETFERAPMIPRDRVKAKYYEVLDTQKVESASKENEKDRCLSCGYCRDCQFCLYACPEQAIERVQTEDGNIIYTSNPDRCIGCGICAGVCPCGIWSMKDNYQDQ